jgi:transposase
MALQDLPQGLPISEEDWRQTPPALRALVLQQQELLTKLIKRIEELEARLGQNSQNSSRPPSSDSPYQRDKRESEGRANPVPRRATKGINSRF